MIMEYTIMACTKNTILPMKKNPLHPLNGKLEARPIHPTLHSTTLTPTPMQ